MLVLRPSFAPRLKAPQLCAIAASLSAPSKNRALQARQTRRAAYLASLTDSHVWAASPLLSLLSLYDSSVSPGEHFEPPYPAVVRPKRAIFQSQPHLRSEARIVGPRRLSLTWDPRLSSAWMLLGPSSSNPGGTSLGPSSGARFAEPDEPEERSVPLLFIN